MFHAPYYIISVIRQQPIHIFLGFHLYQAGVPKCLAHGYPYEKLSGCGVRQEPGTYLSPLSQAGPLNREQINDCM